MTLAQSFANLTNPHHFYLVEGADAFSAQELIGILAEQGVSTVGDVRVFNYGTLGVEEAADIRNAQNTFSESGKSQYFIVSVIAITHEAQQALLKVFEEPRADSHFFLLIPEATSILPTVKSRAQYVKISSGELKYLEEAQVFIRQAKNLRLDFVADFVKSHEDDESSGELRLHASQFILALINVLHKDPKNLILKKDFLADALTMRGYLDNRGASVKMILEHLAISL